LSLIASLVSCGCASLPPPVFGGTVAPGCEAVETAFRRNFTERGELGAAVAAFWRGQKIVDLWGGFADRATARPWTEDTAVVVFSTTKGLAAMTLALAHARGWLDYDAKVSTYWPEFAEAGKEGITVRQLLGHEAGLVLLDTEVSVKDAADLDGLAQILARQTPVWKPGERHGYHASTIGLYMNELLRRVDPMHRSLGRFFQEEIAGPLGIEFYIGLPQDFPSEKLAHLETLTPLRGMVNLEKLPPPARMKVIWPGSLFTRSLSIPAGYDPNARDSLAIELAAGNGVGTARAIAKAYDVLASGSTVVKLDAATLVALYAAPRSPPAGPVDEVMGVPAYFSLGFWKPTPHLDFGSSRRALGSTGAGGSFAFADPDRQLSYAYVMNRMDFYLMGDPREKALRDAVYDCVRVLLR
jgi:CubicO group peptidase (beta-lactamase class C family)